MNEDRTIDPTNPIDTTLSYDSEPGDGIQRAWHAIVHLVVPCRDRYGVPVDTPEAASDYIAETLRDQFLDWSYMRSTDPDTGEHDTGHDGLQSPTEIQVYAPYVEGTFLENL